jgi:hypothetical protein
MKKPYKDRRMKGFERTSGLLQGNIRKVSESRGFAVSRLLTHWAEIVGDDTAKMALPVKVNYGKGGFGATLTVLTTGSQAPFLQASLPKIKDKVNTCYGYAAISRISITQTAPIGFSEGQVAFEPQKDPEKVEIDPDIKAEAEKTATAVVNEDLRRALEALGQNVLSRPE